MSCFVLFFYFFAWSYLVKSKKLFMWLDIRKSNKSTQTFLVGVARYAWAYSKLCQIVSQLYLKNGLNCKFDFLDIVLVRCAI